MVDDIFNPFKRANLLAEIPARCAMEYKESPDRTLVQTFRLLRIFSPALPYSFLSDKARMLNVWAVINKWSDKGSPVPKLYT